MVDIGQLLEHCGFGVVVVVVGGGSGCGFFSGDGDDVSIVALKKVMLA